MFSNEWFSHLEIANKAINQDQIVALGVRQDMTPSPLFLYLCLCSEGEEFPSFENLTCDTTT
jgi:hypothetical protein